MWPRILQNVCEVWHTRKPWVLLFTQGYFEVVIREYAGPSLTTGSMSHPVHLDTNHRFKSRKTHTHTRTDPHVNQSLITGQHCCLKREEPLSRTLHSWVVLAWAHEMTHWLYLFSLGVSVKLNVLCSVIDNKDKHISMPDIDVNTVHRSKVNQQRGLKNLPHLKLSQKLI